MTGWQRFCHARRAAQTPLGAPITQRNRAFQCKRSIGTTAARLLQHIRGVDQPWVVVLAGGEGVRVRSLTLSPEGESVPKQFCRLRRGESLFRSALERARGLTAEARIVPVVRARHRRWWEPDLRGIEPAVVLSQQESRGTAHAVLHALAAIGRRDRDATTLILPSDNMVDDEALFREGASRLLREVEVWPDRLLLLGVEPEVPDTEYGWIVPDSVMEHGTRRVSTFVEKPLPTEARELMRRGGLVSTFVMAAKARTLAFLYRLHLPDLLETFAGEPEDILRPGRLRRSWDFSRDLLARATAWQRVLAVPSCGWCDLGTPERLRWWLDAHDESFVWGAT